MLVLTALLSLLYVSLAIRFCLRIASSDLNSSARLFFYGALASTAVLYVVAVLQAVVHRNRKESLIPVGLAACFGIGICILFFGR